LVFASQTPAMADSKQIIFEVPVSITGFETGSFPSKIAVVCQIFERTGPSTMYLLGESERTVAVDSRSPQRLVSVHVERRNASEIFKKGDEWQCAARVPGASITEPTVDGILGNQ